MTISSFSFSISSSLRDTPFLPFNTSSIFVKIESILLNSSSWLCFSSLNLSISSCPYKPLLILLSRSFISLSWLDLSLLYSLLSTFIFSNISSIFFLTDSSISSFLTIAAFFLATISIAFATSFSSTLYVLESSLILAFLFDIESKNHHIPD